MKEHKGAYINPRFTDRINRLKVQTIVECGSRDGLDAIKLYEFFRPCKAYTFECNPEAIELCKKNLTLTRNIELVPVCAWNETGNINFWATDMDKSLDKNLGSSSALYHRDNKDEFFQKQILVPSMRLDDWMTERGIGKIDLLCMDVQGSERQVIEGLGDKISKVQWILTEICFEHYYEGDILFPELKSLMKSKNFNLISADSHVSDKRHHGFANALFLNREKTW